LNQFDYSRELISGVFLEENLAEEVKMSEDYLNAKF